MNQNGDSHTPVVSLTTVDRLVGLLIVGIVLFGAYSWWRATQRAIGREGMMGEMMGTMPSLDSIWYLFGTLIAVSVVLGSDAISRSHLAEALSPPEPTSSPDSTQSTADRIAGQTASDSSGVGTPKDSDDNQSAEFSTLRVLPDDERRIIEPVLDAPGVTQVALRDRSGYSKAKVSQSLSALEERGMIFREKQGRTYRVYPGELLKEAENERD